MKGPEELSLAELRDLVRRVDLMATAHSSEREGTKVGCGLYHPTSRSLIMAANRLPTEVQPLAERLHRPEKYHWIGHAEARAVASAARNGFRTADVWAFLNYHPLCPCPPCAGSLITAGVRWVIGPDRPFPGVDGRVRYDVTEQMFLEAGVRTFVLKVTL